MRHLRQLLLFALLPWAGAQWAAGQELRLSRTEIDFGTIKETQPQSVSIPFQNNGETELRIASVKGSCGCIRGTVDPDILAPGGEGVLTLTYDPANRDGLVQQRLTIASNDPTSPAATVSISAQVTPLVALRPRYLQFRWVDGAVAPPEHAVTVENLGEETLHIAYVRVSDGVTIEGAGETDVAPGDLARYTVRVASETPAAMRRRISVSYRYGDLARVRSVTVAVAGPPADAE